MEIGQLHYQRMRGKVSEVFSGQNLQYADHGALVAGFPCKTICPVLCLSGDSRKRNVQ